MIVRKNFKRDEVLLKVKNRLEASNLELRLRLMQHEVERRKDWLKREMGQILECQQQCKRSSGDSVAIYRDLVFNSHFRYATAYENATLPNSFVTESSTNFSDQNQKNSDTNCRPKKMHGDTYNVHKKNAAAKQLKTYSRLAIPLPQIRNSRKETNSASSIKAEKDTQTVLNNGRRKSSHDEIEPSHIKKDRTVPKYLTNQKQLSNLCQKSNADSAETFSGKLKLPEIVTSSALSSATEAVETSVSDKKNDTGSRDTKNKCDELSSSRISLIKASTERVQSPRESVAKKAPFSPKQTIEQPKETKCVKLPAIKPPLKSNPNILKRINKKGRTQSGREMTNIVARIVSELQLESSSPLFGDFALIDGESGKKKSSGFGGKTNPDSSDANDLCGPPNRLIQKGRFLPEHMSNSDMSDDSKSQSSTDNSPYILYKGRKLKNYVKPQDRFRVDLVTRTWKKQQLYLKLLKNRPDDLTKCSLRWDPALGDSDSFHLSQPAKQKALERMVKENMSRPVPSRTEINHTELNSKVKEFMDSLGNNSEFFL